MHFSHLSERSAQADGEAQFAFNGVFHVVCENGFAIQTFNSKAFRMS